MERNNKETGMKKLLLYAVQILFHPLDCCYFVKRDQKNISIWHGISILVLASLCRILSVYTTHYPLNNSLPERSNIFVLLGILLIPGISWIIASYSTTTLMNGEAKFKEYFVLGCLCYVPYIVVTPIRIIMSHILSGENNGFYNACGVIVVVWIVILEFICFMEANDYGFFKALLVGFISLIVALLIWAFIILIFVFVAQFVIFIQEVILEIRSQMIM